jgi:hypothetical protein
MLCTTVGSLGQRDKLPLLSPYNQTKLIPASTDSASIVLWRRIVDPMGIAPIS